MKGSKALVTSLTNKFKSYIIDNVVSITYNTGNIIIISKDIETNELIYNQFDNDPLYDVVITIS